MTDAALCPQTRLNMIVEVLATDDEKGLAEIAAAIGDYPSDPRLEFLKGGVLAGLRRYEDSRTAMRRAIELAPNYGIARFQLGFLEYTSGEPALAEQTWGPLAERGETDALHLFARGLNRLALDDFSDAIDLLGKGVAANLENPALNRDIRLLIEEVKSKTTTAEGQDAQSETQFLLQQSGLKTQH